MGHSRQLRDPVTPGLLSRRPLQDVASLKRRELAGALPYPPDLLGNIVAAPDSRTLYYGAQQSEANIWLVKRSSSPGIPQ
jgi:hypothetical protein